MHRKEIYYADKHSNLMRGKRRQRVTDRHFWTYRDYDSYIWDKSWKTRYKKKHQWDKARVKSVFKEAHVTEGKPIEEWVQDLMYETGCTYEIAKEELECQSRYIFEKGLGGQTYWTHDPEGEIDGFVDYYDYKEARDLITEQQYIDSNDFITLTLTEFGLDNREYIPDHIYQLEDSIVVRDFYKTSNMLSVQSIILPTKIYSIFGHVVRYGAMQGMFSDRRKSTEEEARLALKYITLGPKLDQI